ncbi:MAG: alpha-L-fucosidase [Ignavibacteriales bacterium]|nr:alpha-L-fucosidase [Ignavibacteriales bacterium]
MQLYKKAGAKYFVSMGTHHDNFFLWDSKIHRLEFSKHGTKEGCGLTMAAGGKKAGTQIWCFRTPGRQFYLVPEWHISQILKDRKREFLTTEPILPGRICTMQTTTPDDKAWLTTNLVFQVEWFNSIQELIDNYQARFTLFRQQNAI